MLKEHEKGSQKGVEFEEYCEEHISSIAQYHGDKLEATGMLTGIIEGSKKGDFVYTIQDSGKKIVLEMKDYSNHILDGDGSLTIYALKGFNNSVHLIDFKKGYHYKISLYKLIPDSLEKQYSSYYEPLVIGFIKQYENDNLTPNIPLVLKKLIWKYFPSFL